MSETLFRFVLGELTNVRVVCSQCKAVAEVPISSLDQQQQQWRCLGCGAVLRNAPRNPDGLDRLASAYRALTGQGSPFEVEFAVPIAPDNKG